MVLPGPLSVKIEHRPLTVAVDASFALSHFGMLATLTLATAANVYLPRSLLGLLDNCEAYRREPAMLGGPVWQCEAGLLDTLAGQLDAWRSAWHFGRASARLHWLGDASYESAPAAREDGGLLSRFEICAAALDEALLDGPFDLQAPLDACLRDALALAAAVQPDPVVVLLAGGTNLVPTACRAINAAGLSCSEGEPGERFLARPDFAEAGTALELAGAVQLEVLAPGALALPEAWSGEDGHYADESGSEACEPWRDVRCLWTRLYDRPEPMSTPAMLSWRSGS